MSNYRALAYHPTSGRLEVATMVDDAFGPHHYGVAFEDATFPTARRPDPVDLFLIAQEMAEALDAVVLEALEGDDVSVWQVAKHAGTEALAKWRDFTNAKEKTDG